MKGPTLALTFGRIEPTHGCKYSMRFISQKLARPALLHPFPRTLFRRPRLRNSCQHALAPVDDRTHYSTSPGVSQWAEGRFVLGASARGAFLLSISRPWRSAWRKFMLASFGPFPLRPPVVTRRGRLVWPQSARQSAIRPGRQSSLDVLQSRCAGILGALK